MAKNLVICENVRTMVNNFNATADNSKSPQKIFPFSFGIPKAVSSFRGREGEVEELNRLFDTSKVVTVHGLGGYGKTQLSCHYAEIRRDKYCGNLVWIKGETESSLKGSFRDVALDLQIPNCKERDIKSVIQEVYNNFDGTRVLFIIDNAQDYRSILEFLPESFKLKDADINVLITSQSTKWGNTIPELPLQGLSLEYALKVLSAIIGEDKFNSIPKNEWKDLAETFHCIPLGLQIAGGYVRQRFSSSFNENVSIKRYIARIEEKNMLLDEELAVDSGSNYKKTIYGSLLFTVEKIESNNAEKSKWALDIINVCAHLNPDDITVDLLLQLSVIGGSMDKLEEALGDLEQHSLIISKERKWIRVHRLVQTFFLYHQGKCQSVTKFYKEALYTIAIDFNYWFNTQCVHILADTNNLKMLLESLTGLEKKTVMKEWKLLHVASQAVLLDVMHLLLQHGADVNISCTMHGYEGTPLCFLINVYIGNFDETKRRRWEDAVRLLLKHKPNIAVRDSCDQTILHAAAEWKCSALIDHILDKSQLDVNVKGHWDRAPLHWVTERQISGEVEMSKAKECIQVLVSRNADINARDIEGRTVLHYTAMYGNWPLTEFLIDQFGMDSNMRDRNGNTPLLLICDRLYLYTEQKIDRVLKTLEALVKRGALINFQNENGLGILHLAFKEKCLPLIEYLVDTYSLNVNIQDCNECTPLHFLAMVYWDSETEMEESKEVVLTLMQHGANINATNSEGVPILSMASSACNTVLITYLLEEYQADINQRDNKGRTPLFWTVLNENELDAYRERKEATIKLLISKNANPAVKDNKSRTILHYCALKLSSQLLEYFIDRHGLNPNEQDINGFTALHFIAANEYIYYSKDDAIRCINILRNQGARVDLTNNENLTPAQLAENSINCDLIPFL